MTGLGFKPQRPKVVDLTQLGLSCLKLRVSYGWLGRVTNSEHEGISPEIAGYRD